MNIKSTRIKRFLLEIFLSIRSGVVKGQHVCSSEGSGIFGIEILNKSDGGRGSYDSRMEGYLGCLLHRAH